MTSLDLLERRLHDPGECVLPVMLDRQAAKRPEDTLIIFDDHAEWTYAETARLARGTAAALEELGVSRGHRVLVLMHDSPTMFRLALGIFYLGAIYVPLNPEFVRSVLEDAIENSDAAIMVSDADLLHNLDGISTGALRQIVAVSDINDETTRQFADIGINLLPQSAIAPLKRDPKPLSPALSAWEPHSIFFSSGTTGEPKGVVCTYMHTGTMAIDGLRHLQDGERLMSPSAFFHIAGAYVPWAVIAKGGSMAMVGKFSTSRFWDQVRRLKVNGTVLLGVMVDFLMKAAPKKGENDHPLRFAVTYPLPNDPIAFKRRFGIEVYTQYDQTEMGPPIICDFINDDFIAEHGFCGTLREGYSARLVDENDCEVEPGEVGELVVRCKVPWVIATEYFENPSATAKAWRNGWYHTGDRFRVDCASRYYFVDRSANVIRRRGENISSHVLEREAVSHPSVSAAAAYAVDSEFSEHEIMIAIELIEGSHLSYTEFSDYMASSLPAFMVPRFVRIVDRLEPNVTNKISKKTLMSEGISQDAWDKEKASTLPAYRSNHGPKSTSQV